MSKVRIYGDTSGYVDIAVPAVAGTTTLNLDKIPQADISGNIAMDTDTLFVDAANNRVGIGTTSPSDDLEINPSADEKGITLKTTSSIRPYLNFDANRSGANQQVGRIQGKWNGTTITRIEMVGGSDTTNKDDGYITFQTASSASDLNERIRITSSGNVGIGTNNPSQKLHISSADHTRVLITGGTDKYAELQFENDAQKFAMGVQNDDKFFLYNSTGSSSVFEVDTSSNIIFKKIVGIGDSTLSTYHTSYPALELGASASVQGYTGNNGVWLQSNLFMNTNGQWTSKSNDYSAMLELYDGQFNFYNTASGTGTRTLLRPMTIKQDGKTIFGYSSGRVPVSVLVPHVNSSITPAMRISTYGVGGYSSSNSSNAGARLEFGQYDDGYDWVTGSITSIRTGGSWGGDLTFYTNNNSASTNQTERMRINSSGNVGIGTTGPTSSGYDSGSTKLSVMSTTLNNATSGYLELSSRANTNGYNAGAIQFNNFENANTAGSGTQNRTVGQIRTVITTTDSNAGDDSGGTMQFWTKPEAQALANTMRISTNDPSHRADVTVDATGLAGDGGANANAFFNAKAKGNYYAGTRIHSNSGHVGGWIGHWNGSSTARELQARVGGNGLNSSDYIAIRSDYLGRVTHPNRPHFRVRGFSSHRYVNVIQGGEDGRLRDWNTVDINRGSHFTNSTGKFTIPITGDYAFYCTVMYTNPSTQDFHLTFKLNGGTLTASNDHNGGGSGQGHQWNGTTLCYSGYFSANDYVGYSITGGGSTSTVFLYQSNTYNVMGGYLL